MAFVIWTLTAPGGKPQSVLWLFAAALVRGTLNLLAPTLAVVVASRLYEQLGDRVNRASPAG